MKKLLLLFCVLLSAVGAKATSVTVYDENGVEYWLTDFSQGSCVSGLLNPSNTTSVTVKSSVSYEGKSYPIVRVGVGAFSGNTQLQSITLPSSITKIGTNAFNGCTGLKIVSFAANSQLATIESSAFLGCTSLTTFNLSGLSQLTEIDYNAFYGCTSLRSVQLPAQITKINDGVFRGCSSLNSINWSNLTEIGSSAFSGTAFTALDFSAMTALTEIGSSAFSNCTNLARVTLPTQTTKINSGTFSGCSSLNSLNWSDLTRLTEIGSSAFEGTAFSALSLPSRLTTVGDYAFQNCTNLTTAKLPAIMTAFPTGLFKGCTALRSVAMNIDGATVVGASMFEGCTSLSSIISRTTGSLVYKPIGEKAFSKCSSLPNSDINNLLSISNEIGAYAFEGCTGLTEITGLSDSHTTEIGEGAFSGCWDLTSFTAPNNLWSIGAYAFKGCGSLTTATFGSSLTSIGSYAFAETPITSVSLPGTVTEIADDAFSDCSHLTSLTIGNDNDSDETLTIGDNAFCGSHITTLDLPDHVVSIGENAFGSCRQLATVNISDHSQLESIDSWAFYNTAIKKITIPSSVNSVANDAFLKSSLRLILNHSNLLAGELGYGHVVVIDQPQDSWCDTQTGDWYYDAAHTRIAYIESTGASYTVADGVTSIGNNAFYGQTSLYSLTIPASVTRIGTSAFADCSLLTSVILNNSNPDNISLGGGEFSGIASDAKLSVPLGSSRQYKANASWARQFSVIRLIDDALTLVEGQPYTLAYGEDNVRVTYNRRFNTNKWQALYIPFEMTSAEWSQFGEVAEISGVHQYEGSSNDVVTVIEFRKLKSGESVQPNTPYVFKVKEAYVNCEIALANNATKQLLAADNGEVWCASTRNTYTLTGVYEQTPIADGYAIGGGDFQHVQGATLSPYRFYLSVSYNDHGYGTGADSSTIQNAPARIGIMVDGVMDDPTGIYEIVNSQSSDSESVYDLQGRRVATPQKGQLYIVNGKKVIY